MEILPYVAVVVNCCVFPMMFMYAGFVWGRFGLPVSVKKGWGKTRIKGIRKRDVEMFDEPRLEDEE